MEGLVRTHTGQSRYKADAGKNGDKCPNSAKGLSEEGEINYDRRWSVEDCLKI